MKWILNLLKIIQLCVHLNKHAIHMLFKKNLKLKSAIVFGLHAPSRNMPMYRRCLRRFIAAPHRVLHNMGEYFTKNKKKQGRKDECSFILMEFSLDVYGFRVVFCVNVASLRGFACNICTPSTF